MNLLKSIMRSKKAVMFVAGILATYVILPFANTRLGLGWTQDQIGEALYALCAYLVGQGVADHGKAKAALETDQWAERAYAAEAELSALKHKRTAGDIATEAEKHARSIPNIG